MPPVRTMDELINGMEFRSRARGRLIRDTARAEGKTLGMLQAADEIEQLLKNEGEHPDFAAIMRTWVRATREAAAMSATEKETI